MIDEIVRFSADLAEMGIYDRLREQRMILDKPVLVIPVKDDLSGFDPGNMYVVVKDYDKSKIVLEEVHQGLIKDKELIFEDETAYNNFSRLPVKKVDELPEEWKNIILSIKDITRKLKIDSRGNKSIGTNSGVNSYHLLAFEATRKGVLYNRNEFFRKVPISYKRNNIKKGLPESLDSNKCNAFIDLFSLLHEDVTLKKLWHVIEPIIKILNKPTFKSNIDSFNILFQLPSNYYPDYYTWYDEYIKKKLLAKKDDKSVYLPSGECTSCRKHSDNKIFLPAIFNNANDKKPFLLHKTRTGNLNVLLCEACVLKLYHFETYFLGLVNIFPLFIKGTFKDKELELLKSEGSILVKRGFKEIITAVFENTDETEFDYYLLIYNQKQSIVSFDYITGFKFNYKKGKTVFDIETLFENSITKIDTKTGKHVNSLRSYYFTNPDTKNLMLDNIIYKYRTIIFDFVYRARYTVINKDVIRDLLYDLLVLRLRYAYTVDGDKLYIKALITRFIELDHLFAHEEDTTLMGKIEDIKQSRDITTPDSFFYYAGQVVYYLLKQSEANKKSHALVEPFINVANIAVLITRIMEMFEKYKHALSLNNAKFSTFETLMHGLFAFAHDNKDIPCNKDAKIVFYAGYFGDNIMYEKKGES